jgi:hypothetical protein
VSAPYRRYDEFIDGPCEKWNADDREEETVMGITKITPKDARDLLGVLGEDGGWATGGFTEALIAATMRADTGNRQKLWREYPGMVEAIVLYKDVPGGVETLQKIAAGA